MRRWGNPDLSLPGVLAHSLWQKGDVRAPLFFGCIVASMADHAQPRLCPAPVFPRPRISILQGILHRPFASPPPPAPSAATPCPRLMLCTQRQSISKRWQKPLLTPRKLLQKGLVWARAACIRSQTIRRQAYDHGLQRLPTRACLAPLCLIPLLPPLSVTALAGSAPTAAPQTGVSEGRTRSPPSPCRFG